MTEPLDSDKLDRRLWRQFSSQAQEPQTPQIDPNDLAAYLDGSADPQQVELIESRLAADADFLAEVKDLRRISQLDAPCIPASVLARARSLAHPRLWPTRIRWAATAAAVLLACVAGYKTGAATGQSRLNAHDASSMQISLDFNELMSDSAMGIILPTNGSNGR